MEEDAKNSMNAPSTWQTTPLRSKVIFLLAVFFVFVGIQFANDVISLGRENTVRFAITAVVSGLFAVAYAVTGIILRGKFWKAFLPMFAVHFSVMLLLANRLPDAPAATAPLTAAGIEHLHGRIALDGVAIIICICLGYAGFVIVSISEGRRYLKTQLEKASLESEMGAAREVQRVMVPEVLPAVSGYAIESVYKPAAEVGGDFFQVIPVKSGRTLVVIGDVSGKGLRAAMIVSMIMGILRTLSEFTEDPAEILAELNRRNCGRGDGAFATCLVLRLDEDGRVVLANAGHLPPYLNGAEIPFAGSMPLGLVESAVYADTSLEMRAGDRAVLLTDGIAEARNGRGELLGFPRVESLLREGASARSIAEIAERHGQEDDITVISIARRA